MGMFLNGHYGRKGLISCLRENIQLGERVFLVLISLIYTIRATGAGFYRDGAGVKAKAGIGLQYVIFGCGILVSLIIHIECLKYYVLITFRCKIPNKVDRPRGRPLWEIHHQVGRVVIWHSADRAGDQGQGAVSR